MANSNTIASTPYNLTGPTSAVETAIAAQGSSTVRAVAAVPANVIAKNNWFDGHPFKVRAVSKFSASGAGNFTLNIYVNLGVNTNLTTFTNDILLIGSGALAMASSTGVVFLEATCLWDSATGRLAAKWDESGGLANIVTTPAIIKSSSAVTATNPISATGVDATSDLSFFVTHTMSANATSSSLVELCIDRI